MPSSKPNYTRRLQWLTVFIIVLFGGYSAGWFYVAGRVNGAVAENIAKIAAGGTKLDCANHEVRGFPFRMGLFCDSVSYADPSGNIRVSARALRTAAQVYQPMLNVAELDSPARVEVKGLPPIDLNWANMQASVRVDRPLPRRTSVVFDKIDARSVTPDGPKPIFNAQHLEAHLVPDGPDLAYAGSAAGFHLLLPLPNGQQLPPLDATADLRLINGVAFATASKKSLRGQSGEIRSATLTMGGGSIAISGPLSVDAQGLVSGDLSIAVTNPQALGTALSQALPERASQIQMGIGALAAMGQQVGITLSIRSGQAQLGFIPLGKVPALP